MNFHYKNAMRVFTLAVTGLVTASMIKRSSPEFVLQLAASSPGRIALHVVCLWKDHCFLWHWQGIRREFRANLPHPPKR
jgi:hypothetical protein